MKELELMTSEEYRDKLLSVEMVNAMYSVDKTIKAKEKIQEKIMKLIKLLKDEIPDYSTRFTH